MPDTPAAERDEAGKFKPRSGKPRNDPQARVQQATAKEAAAKEEARQAREEANGLKARLEALERANRPAEQPRPAQPQATNGRFPGFDAWSAANPDKDFDDYIDARADHRYQTLEKQRQEAYTANQYRQQLTAATQTDPVFAAALNTNPPPVSKLMEQAILSSQKSIDIVRYLAAHPEDCTQLAQKSVNSSLDAVDVMRDALELRVTAGAVASRPDAASAVKPSTANPPIHRVGGTASATPVDPDDLPFGPDYIRAENAREKKRQEQSRW
jgi:hypothetical protein